MAEIGIVARTLGKYNVYLGGNLEGTRINVLYRELVPSGELTEAIRAVLVAYVEQRQPGEALGDWATRVGVASLPAATVLAVDTPIPVGD